MSIKIDLMNQIRQTTVPTWKPLLPLFEAVMNSFQAIKEADLGAGKGRVLIEVERRQDLIKEDSPPITGFRITDNGIGLDDDNFDSFNTAYSTHKIRSGGKGLGRFTWLKAYDKAVIESTFRSGATFVKRQFVFDEHYDLDDRGLPKPCDDKASRTVIGLVGLKSGFSELCPKTSSQFIQKLIEHFILVFLEPDCPSVTVHDLGKTYDINKTFKTEYQASASSHHFKLSGQNFTVHGFRIPTSRATKHKLVYAADQRAVVSDKLEDHLPNLKSRLEDNDGKAFCYMAIIQSPYLSEHVNPNRTDFDFSAADDADTEPDLLAGQLIPRADIRNQALQFIQRDLEGVIKSINAAKLERIQEYIRSEAPQYRILLKYAPAFIDSLPPRPSRADIDAALHKELHTRETELRRESTRIIKEADKIENYEEYYGRLTAFLDQYNELGVSALVQYVAHRKIILDFLKRAIETPADSPKYALEEVVHRLVFPMGGTSEDTPYHEQNLWIIDERLTYHSLIASDKQLRTLGLLKTKSAQRGDIVIFDEKILFSDVDPAEHPISSITTIEFKRPGRDDYTATDNPLQQAFTLIEEIRASKFKVKGRPVTVTNQEIPASIYCICDLTKSMRQILRVQDAFEAADKESYYGFHRGYNAYFEVIDYNKMLRDAKKRNRILFDKLNIPPTE